MRCVKIDPPSRYRPVASAREGERSERITNGDTHGDIKVRVVNPSIDSEPSTVCERDENDEHPGNRYRLPIDSGRAAVIPNAPVDGIYRGSNGRYYTDRQVTNYLRAERWNPCIRQRNPERRLVATSDDDLLLLLPTDDIPAWAEIRVDNRGARIVDTRRPLPK